MKWLVLVLLALSAHNSAFALEPSNANPENAGIIPKSDVESQSDGALKHPKVSFVTPKDGANVSKKFKVKFKVDGMSIKPANTMEVGTGHHHLLIDSPSVPKGQVVPKDEKNLHFGKGESETELNLSPGEHTLTLQFADGSHISYGPELSQTIKVKVK
jgi:hypothetical protein